MAVAVARPLLSSQSSQLSENTVLTPVTQIRLSGVFAASPLSSPLLAHVINDDNTEKKRRLKARLSDRVQKHLTSPASERSVHTSHLIIFLHIFSLAHVTFAKCIKINKKNLLHGTNFFRSRNKSQSLHLAGWNASQISDHLHNCIQLSRENVS